MIKQNENNLKELNDIISDQDEERGDSDLDISSRINLVSDLKEKIKQLKENNESNKKLIEDKQKELESLKTQNKEYMNKAQQIKESNSSEMMQINQKYNKILEELQQEKNKNDKIKKEYEDYKKNISKDTSMKITQKEAEINNYLKIVQQGEVDIAKSKAQINELNNKLNQNEITIKKYEKEIADLNGLKQKEKDFNIKLENIKEQYKKTSEEEIKKIRKGLLKQIGDKLSAEKKKYNDLYLNQENNYNSKFNEFSKIMLDSKVVTNSLNSNNEIRNLDNNIPKPETNLMQKVINTNDILPIMQVNNSRNDYNDNHINENENENVMQNNVKNSLNDNTNNNNDKNFTNKGQEVDTGDIVKNYINQANNNNNNVNNNNYNIINENNNIDENIEEEPMEEEYSYDCTNSMYLTVYIYEGTEDAEFEIFLRNNGTQTWAEDSKLINDPSSFLKTDIILLAQQKPNEERGYKTVIKNLGRYADGEYKAIFLFYTKGKIRGEKITAMVKIKEKDNKKSEIEENMDKISEFRDTFNLSEEEYSNEKIFEILKDNDFNFESAFSSLFN